MTLEEAIDQLIRGVNALEEVDPEIEDYMESVVEALMNRYPQLMVFGPSRIMRVHCSGRKQ